MTAKPLFLPVRHVLRLTIEAKTPLSASAGDISADRDNTLFRDWNGLPCLSGATVAGVLRSIYRDYYDDEHDLFGVEENISGEGRASRLMVSFGAVHDRNNVPVTGYRAPAQIESDPVLRLLAAETPLLRDHVAISQRGAAEDQLKFDRTSCPAGTRFTLELSLDGTTEAAEADGALLRRLAALFSVPYIRFGGAARRGLGRMQIVAGAEVCAFYAAIDRTGPDGRARWIAYRQGGLAERPAPCGFVALNAAELSAPAAFDSRRVPIEGRLRLRPKWFWRIGQGDIPWDRAGAAENEPDMMPRTEPVICWSGGERILTQPMAPVPGSAVKGAIAHRTEFHLRRLRGCWASEAAEKQRQRLVDGLLGAAAGKPAGGAGSLLIDDIVVDRRGLSRQSGIRTRNSIDRHTGGVRLQKLFTDEALWQGPALEIPITLLARGPGSKGWVDPDMVTALDWALSDLCDGRLALGAREGIGDGICEGAVVCTVAGGKSETWSSFGEALRAAQQHIPGEA